MNNYLKKGFSLLEIMIAVAAMGGLSLVLMQMNKTATRSTVKSQFDTDTLLITNEINGILSDPVKCLNTFTNPVQTSFPNSIYNEKYYTTSSGSSPANGYGNSGLKITSYTLTIGGTANDGVLTIAYQNKNILKGSSGTSNIKKIINLYIEGSPGAITKCRALSSSTTDIWTRGTATDSNNIFYNGGVRSGDETQSMTCDSTTEGTQRYNKTTHAMEFCGYSAGPPVSYFWQVLKTGLGCRVGPQPWYVVNSQTITCGGSVWLECRQDGSIWMKSSVQGGSCSFNWTEVTSDLKQYGTTSGTGQCEAGKNQVWADTTGVHHWGSDWRPSCDAPWR